MKVSEAVRQASKYLPEVFEVAAGKELRLEGVEKTEDGKFWTVTFSYSPAEGSVVPFSRDYKTVKLKDSDGELIGARNGLLLSEM
jgi:hypothetical protein